MTVTLFYLSLALFCFISWNRIVLGLGFILLLLPSYLLRIEIFSIPTTWLELAIYLIAIIWLLKNIINKNLVVESKILYKKYKFLLLGLLLWFGVGLLATITSPDLRLSAGVLKAWWFDSILFTILLLFNIKKYSHLIKLYKWLIGGAALAAGYGLFEYIFGVGMQADGLVNSFYKPANYLAMLVVPIIMLGLGIQKIERNRIKQLTYISILIALPLVALWYTQSYGGFLGLVMGFFVFFLWQKNSDWRKRGIVALVILGLMLVIFLSNTTKFQNLISGTERNSLTTRLQIWEISIQVLKENYLLGVGLGNFQQPYREMAYNMYQPPLEWEVVKAHNLYLNIWLETGLLGLIVFLYLLFLYAKSLKQNLLKINKEKTWWLLASTTAALASILAHGLLDTPYFKNDLALLFFFIFIAPFVIYNLDDI